MKPILFFFLLCGLIQANKLVVSILDFSGEDLDPSVLKACYNKVESSMTKSDRFVVISKSAREQSLQEQEFISASGACDETNCAVEIGKLIGAEYLMLGEILQFAGQYQYNLKIVSVQESKITASETDEIKTKDIGKLLDDIEMASQKLISTIAVGVSPQVLNQQTFNQPTITKSFGSVYIESVPSQANIIIDGTAYGLTPQTISDLEVGQRNLRLRFPGYEDLSKIIVIEKESTIDVTEYLVPKTGGVTVLSDPPGASVFVENKLEGKTPLPINGLKVGDYMIRLSLDNYKEVNRRVTIQYGQQPTNSFDLEPLPGKVNFYTDPGNCEVRIVSRKLKYDKKHSSDGTGMLSVSLLTGSYEATITKNKYEKQKINLTIGPNGKYEEEINLIRIPEGVSSNPDMGFLTINSYDPSIKLKIARVREIQSLPLEYFELKRGNYRIKAYGKGLESKSQVVNIKAQETTKLEINLDPKDRAKAAKYSMMFPGAGQFYSGSNRTILYSGAFLGASVLLAQSIPKYFDDKKLLDQYQLDYSNATTMDQIDQTWSIYENQSNKVNNARNNLIILGTTIASSWLTSVIDAYFFSGL